MAKRITLIDERTGRVITVKAPPKQAKLIPWTPAPKTRWQRIKRDLVG